MESRLLAENLSRSRSLPLLPFLAPSLFSKSWSSRPQPAMLYAVNFRNRPLFRDFHSNALSEQATSSGAAVLVKEEEDSPGSHQPETRSSTDIEQSATERMNKLLDETIGGYRLPAEKSSRTSQYNSYSGQAAHRGESSSDAVRRGFERSRQGKAPFVDVSSMMFPRVPAQDKQNAVASSVLDQRMEPLLPPIVRLGPSVGRTVEVDLAKGMDLGRSFRQLDINCNRNQVKQDFNRQRFHERPGLKRKRLKSARWRKKFREGFKAVVNKVVEMKRQGW